MELKQLEYFTIVCEKGSFSQAAAHAAIKYEMPVKGTPLRPAISLRYDFHQATDGDMKGLTRNTLTVTAAATF